MSPNFAWLLIFCAFAGTASAFFTALTNSHSGEVAQALANLLGAGVGGSIAVFAAYSQVKISNSLREKVEIEKSLQRVRSGRVALCINAKIIGDQCLRILDSSLTYRNSPHSLAYDLIIEPISLSLAGVSYGELNSEEIRRLMVFHEAIFEVRRILRNRGYLAMAGGEYANLISRIEGACEDAADFLEIAAGPAGMDLVEEIKRFHVIRCQ